MAKIEWNEQQKEILVNNFIHRLCKESELFNNICKTTDRYFDWYDIHPLCICLNKIHMENAKDLIFKEFAQVYGLGRKIYMLLPAKPRIIINRDILGNTILKVYFPTN